MRVWMAGRPDEVLTEKKAGTGCDSEYWWVNAGNFASPWKSGEELIVVLEDGANGLCGKAGSGSPPKAQTCWSLLSSTNL